MLANDTDVDGDTLTAVLVSGPAQGAVTLGSNGGYTWAPHANFNGKDSFTYRARDASGAVSNLATATITVTPANDAPQAVNDSYTLAEDNTLSVTAPGVLSNDLDVDGDPLTVAVPRPLAGPFSIAGPRRDRRQSGH